jgi:outer membrane protein OmpU
MNNFKKIGLSALAGSLVAFSAANAGSLSVSGAAKFTYTGDTGNEDAQDDGNRFGIAQSVGFTGTAELDNGHTASISHAVNGSSSTSSVITYDMGDLGTLRYQQDSGALGIGIIDDLTPTADEEVWNGIDADIATSNETPVGRVSGGTTGFNYRNSSVEGLTVDIGYAPKSTTGTVDEGGNSGTGGLRSTTSIAVQYSGMDGLNIYAGTGTIGNAANDTDVDTMGIKYAWGPVTVGYQRSETDYVAANSDLTQDMYSIAFAVNDNLSISYGSQETEKAGSALDQKISGFSIGYSMGGMTIKAHNNKGENIANQTANESEHTEIAVSFAF